jgi:hypothetical protein
MRDAESAGSAAAGNPPPAAPLLCLPGPAFWHDHSRGELVVRGTPLVAHAEGGQGRGTAWAVWDAAVVAALWLDQNAPDEDDGISAGGESAVPWAAVRERGALELGAGTGLAGLAACAALRCHVTLTDLAEALPALQRNCAANEALAPRLSVRRLDWARPGDVAECAALRPALLLAADCVWLEPLVAPFVAAVDALMGPEDADTRLLLVHQTRSAGVDAALWRALHAARLLPAPEAPEPQEQPCGAEAAPPRVYLLRRCAARTPR